jgi:predicted Zn-dependent protease
MAVEINKQKDKARAQRMGLRLALSWLFIVLSVSSALAQPAKRRANQPPTSAAFEQLTKRAVEARLADQLDEAAKLYQQALKQKPKWVEGWWSLGTIYYQQDRYREGRDAFQRLVALEPKGGIGWAFLGMCEYQLKDYQAALMHLQRGRNLGLGGNQEIANVVRYHTAVLLNRFAQFELSYAVLQELGKFQNESPAIFEAFGLMMLRLPYLPVEIPADKREVVMKTGRAAYFMAADKRKEAAQEFQELMAAFPQTPGTHYAYGLFFLRDSPDEAVREFKNELQLSPKHVFARLQLAFEFLKRGEPAAGLVYAEEAVQLAPDLFAAHNALGRILLEIGQIERAIKELELGVKQAPDSPEMYFALARAYTKAGRKVEAEKARNEFTRLDKLRRATKESFVGETTQEKKPE